MNLHEILRKYLDDNQDLVYPDVENVNALGVETQTSRLINVQDKYLRHNANKVAAYVIKQLIDIL